MIVIVVVAIVASQRFLCSYSLPGRTRSLAGGHVYLMSRRPPKAIPLWLAT